MSPTDLPAQFSGVCMFTAGHCGPCQQIKPIIRDELCSLVGADCLTDFFKEFDVVESSSMCEKYEIKKIPVIMFFMEGKPISTVVGANTAAVKSGIAHLVKAGAFEKECENQNGLPICADASVPCQMD